MLKFLGSSALFPVKLVVYPLMVPMAILQVIGSGAYVALVQLPMLILWNLGSILKLPITVPIAVGKWAIRNRGSIAIFPFASIKVAKDEGSDGGVVFGAMVFYLYCLVTAALTTSSSVPWIALAETPLASLPSSVWKLHQMGMIQPLHYVFAASALLLASNVFVGLFMAGGAYYRYLMSPKPSPKEEIPEAKVMAPQSHLTMFSKIQDKDKVSEEEGWTLLGEAVEVGKNGKMKLGDVPHLAKMICDRAPSTAVVH